LLIVVSILVLLAVAFLFLSLGLAGRGSRETRAAWMKKRLSALSKEHGREAMVSASILRDELMSQIPALHKGLSKVKLAHKLDRLLRQAESPMRVGELLLFTLVFAAAGFGLGYFIGRSVISGIVGGGALGCLPTLNVVRRKRKRVRSFVSQFPDALDLMTSALRAGHAFTGAIQLVADEMPDPVSSEFKETFDEQNLGLSFKEALMNLAERIDSMDVRFFVIAMVIQRETGGNVAEILEKISYTIRERFKILGQLRSLTADARLSGIVLALLPVVVGLIIMLINPSYIMFLFKDPTGRLMLGVAGTMMVIGYIWIRKIVNIEV
jgi:tight adherence protein B